jgi:hypothetical protein
MVEDGRMSDKTTYSEVSKDFTQLLEEGTGAPDFPFSWDLLQENLPGMDRGNLGIIFARPEVGKTTFCAFIAASYIKQKQRVVYWANEEPAEKIKLRIIQSYFGMTYDEMNAGAEALLPRCLEEIEPYLTVMDSVGTSMAREIAKRNKLLVWSVSQASFEAHDRQFIDYAMLDGSRTGKAGEADVIIGIGKTGTSEEENTTRHICISKNKLNGWHGMFNSHIDIQRGVYY